MNDILRGSGFRPDTCRRIERVLLVHRSVADCAVFERATRHGDAELIAYVVAPSAFVRAELVQALAASGLPPPAQFVTVGSIPRNRDGSVDAAALLQLPVVDEALTEQLQAQAERLPGIARAACVIGAAPKRLPLHLSALVPDWRFPEAGPRQADQRRVSADDQAYVAGTPAMADGGPLPLDPGGPAVLGDVLDRAAGGDEGVLYVHADGTEHFESYAELRTRAQRLLAGLQALGLRTGDRVVLQIEHHRNFIGMFWACVLGGLVPVPLANPTPHDRATDGLQPLHGIWDTLGRPVVVAERDRLSAIRNSAASMELLVVAAVEDLETEIAGGRHRPEPDDAAVLMLTSGSTGAPKAVMLTHRNLVSRCAASRQMNGFTPRDVTLNWMPLDHVAGLIYFHVRDVYLACRQIHVPTGVILADPLKWLDELDRHRATITFAPNFAFALVNDREKEIGRRSWDLSCVRHVLNGAEAIVPRTARTFLRLLAAHGLPRESMRPAWGMSETSSGVIYGDRFSLDTTADDDPFVEVGRPIPGLSVRIVDADDRVLDQGQAGRLQVRGAVVTSGYFNAPELTKLAFTDHGWFKTGDLGTIRDGRVTVTGREKDVIIVNSVNYYCHAIEAAVEAVAGVETSFVAACPVRPPGANTDRLAVFFHGSHPARVPDLLPRIRAEVLARIGIAPDYLVPVEAAALPKTSLGKIQRSELSRRFLAGEFDQIIEQVDRLAANANTIPDWFYRKTWRQKEGIGDAAVLGPGDVALVFSGDGDRLGAEVRQRLEHDGVRCCTVIPGESFEQRSAGVFSVDPRQPDDYMRLVTTLALSGIRPNHVFHLWGCASTPSPVTEASLESALYVGPLSAAWLAKAFSTDADPTLTRFTFVATRTQRVAPLDTIACDKTPVIGMLKSLAQELAWLRCRHVDLDLDREDGGAAAAERCIEEARVVQQDVEVAYRNGSRFVAALERVAFADGASGQPPFARGATYVLTGGSGGIGGLIAEMLLDRFDAKVLLVGRSAPDERREALLSRLGDARRTVAYEAADVCDEARLAYLFDKYEAEWGQPIRGVIHLAGSYDEGAAIDTAAKPFVAVLRPKTLGTDVLHRLLTARGGGDLISSSSVAGFFAGAGISAYAAANTYQQAFADEWRDRGVVRHYCFSWSNWNGVGQSEGAQLADSARARGYVPLAPQQAILSLLIGLRFEERSLIVGLDGQHRRINRHVVGQADVVERAVLYYEGTDSGTAETALCEFAGKDRFGVLVEPTTVRLLEMPLDTAGRVDRIRLAAFAAGGGDVQPSMPQTDTERRLIDIWQRLLGVSSVRVDQNFFELGGDSLLAARLVAEIHEGFGRAVSLRAIFDAESLADLADAITQSGRAASQAVVVPVACAESLTAAETLARLDDLGDDEVEALLNRMVDATVDQR